MVRYVWWFKRSREPVGFLNLLVDLRITKMDIVGSQYLLEHNNNFIEVFIQFRNIP